MKIRIKDNSIRIRLSRTEVDNFGKSGYLESKTDFGSAAFVYALSRSASQNSLSAGFEAGKITIEVPEAIAHEWTTTDNVGFSHYMDTSNGGKLFLLVEKDFKCVDNSMEDQSDNYDHPTHVCD